jgi:glutaredoxin-like protein
MIPLKEQELIRQRFAAELSGPVKIDFFTERDLGITIPGKTPCHYCKPTQEMLQEIAALHDNISLRVHYLNEAPEQARKYGVERPPAIVLRGLNGYFLKYYGIPAGTEFPIFIEVIVDVSRGELLFSPESVERLRSVKRELSVRVFVTPTCPYCPAMMRAAYQMSMANPLIRSEVIEVSEYPDLAERYNVRAVPLTVIDGRVAIPGMIPEQALVEQVVRAAQPGAPESETPAGPTNEVAPRMDAGKAERGKQRPSGLIIP